MAYSIKISLLQKLLILMKDGKIVRSYPVGVGKTATTTPIGRYHIISKIRNPGGPFGVMWMGLSQPHYGIHGTNNPSSIGGAVSKGCVRMYNRDVLELAGLVDVGTPVTIETN
ncbi:L,D-transpeptidase [Sporomusa malonica]|uniref:L,D-transpeptidase catalytic domain n=1 Tax=Sporomusa malonica TaxID=112901 RepID=A0A1W2D0P4_9FIRM|nr:L,D-transpeptidase [Sporomusa malonica]SMC91061.1 L,D-transpeptidase catalytic domain [Sporomusa malonica]